MERAEVFPRIFDCLYSLVKIQSSVEFLNTVVYPFHFNVSKTKVLGIITEGLISHTACDEQLITIYVSNRL